LDHESEHAGRLPIETQPSDNIAHPADGLPVWTQYHEAN
jgi:hypothetical protein